VLSSAVVVGLLSWIPVGGRNVSAWERSAFHAVNDLPGFLYAPVWVVMQLGNGLAIPVVAVAALAARRARLALVFLLAGGSAYLLADVFKAIVGRGRPGDFAIDVRVRGAVPSGHGYPSGHASVAFALGVAAWLWLGGRSRWVLLAAAVVVGLARVYVGAHFPLDVVGGAALGTSCAAVVSLLVRRSTSAAG
jgi:membrane-associated phospholipid phosphatase